MHTTDKLLCKYLKLHEYEEVLCDYKYNIFQCIHCKSYKIIHKEYDTVSKYKYDKLPNNLKEILRGKSCVK